MIALLLGLALGQQGNRNQCSNDDAFPIAGTSGFENTIAALRTNAATYSASNFVEKTSLRRIANSDAEQVGKARL